MPTLSTNEIQTRIQSLPGWTLANDRLARTFEFADFLNAIAFVDRVALLAEAAGHHPDIDIRYNKVTLHLTSHDAGGITKKDFAVAAEINSL